MFQNQVVLLYCYCLVKGCGFVNFEIWSEWITRWARKTGEVKMAATDQSLTPLRRTELLH